MKTRLLKINAMKKFTRWLDTRRVAPYLWSIYNPLGKIWAGLERRDADASARDVFVNERGKKRNSWKWMFLRHNQGVIGYRLLNYIQKRYERRKKWTSQNGHQ